MNSESFSRRHIGPRESDIEAMLKTGEYGSIDKLIEDRHENIRLKNALELEEILNESDYFNPNLGSSGVLSKYLLLI